MKCHLKQGIAVAVIGAICLLAPPRSHSRDEEPWNYLRGFTPVEGAVSLINHAYVGVVFHDAGSGYLALVVYPGVCQAQDCGLEPPVAFFVVDSGGSLVRHHLEPGTSLENVFGNFQIV